MTGIRLVLAVLAAAAAFATGCGGAGEGKNVKDAIKQHLSDRETGDAEAVCEGMTPESRKLLETIARGLAGPEAGCPEAIEEDLLGGSYALGQQELEAIESSDVNIEGDVARVKGQGDEGDERLPLKKVDGEWRLDYANTPGLSYTLRATALCTQNNLRPQELPLPKPTRAGIASEAKRDADGQRELAALLRRMGPPKDKEEAHEAVLEALRANERDLRRAESQLKGLGAPLNTYNRALKAVGERVEEMRDEQEELGIGCLGFVATREGSGDYRRSADRVCGRALRQMDRLPTASTPSEAASIARRGAKVGRDASTALKRLEAPSGLEELHERSADALRSSYAGLITLSRANDLERAQERFELGALRSAIGFLRIGLEKCAQL